MKKMYRSNRGREVDLETLRQQNAQTLAVGNLNANAQGDIVDASGAVTQRLADRVRASGVATQARLGSVKSSVDELEATVEETLVKTPIKNQPKTKKAAVQETIDSDGNITIQPSSESTP